MYSLTLALFFCSGLVACILNYKKQLRYVRCARHSIYVLDGLIVLACIVEYLSASSMQKHVIFQQGLGYGLLLPLLLAIASATALVLNLFVRVIADRFAQSQGRLRYSVIFLLTALGLFLTRFLLP